MSQASSETRELPMGETSRDQETKISWVEDPNNVARLPTQHEILTKSHARTVRHIFVSRDV
ncbi:hypothetical protein GN958_ATG23263 [Phytophthora infestans]|uniref:Uncharacterized protein n=1 Tax=Phytophthora infestans TaxID=4787 RepID=A0A8S9TLT8_PHYIN|nr:hypothetical protein GN958_ATG23263 [Phytophthora infestans]